MTVLIGKGLSGKFWVYLRGHMPNERFKSLMASSYKIEDAYKCAHLVASTAKAITKKDVSLLVTELAKRDIDVYTQYMAFETIPLEVK